MAVPKLPLLSVVRWKNSLKFVTNIKPQVVFTKLSGLLDDMEFDEVTMNDLSSDQRLLLEYVLGISRGKCQPKACAWKIEPLNHAR